MARRGERLGITDIKLQNNITNKLCSDNRFSKVVSFLINTSQNGKKIFILSFTRIQEYN